MKYTSLSMAAAFGNVMASASLVSAIVSYYYYIANDDILQLPTHPSHPILFSLSWYHIMITHSLNDDSLMAAAVVLSILKGWMSERFPSVIKIL